MRQIGRMPSAAAMTEEVAVGKKKTKVPKKSDNAPPARQPVNAPASAASPRCTASVQPPALNHRSLKFGASTSEKIQVIPKAVAAKQDVKTLLKDGVRGGVEELVDNSLHAVLSYVN